MLINELLKKNLIRKLNKEDYEKPILEKDEYLLKIEGTTGFMSPLTQKKEIPKSFLDWHYRNDIYIIKEEFREGWKMMSVRSGMSTAWVLCKHPFGFNIEINPKSFNNLISKIEINKGIISSPLYFVPNIKNSELITK